MDFFSKANESLQQPAIIQEISGNANLENIQEILNDDPSQINAIDSREGMEGYTALHYACWDAKTDIAKYLIGKGADVHLKEGRNLIISPRESPLSLIHLKNMISLMEAGAKIVPPIPAWYSNPKTLDEMVDFITVRLFDVIDEDLSSINRWKDKE